MITLWSEWRYSVFTRAVCTSEADCDMIFGVSCPGLELIHNSLPSDQRRTLATEISDETEENLMFICLIVSPNFSLSDRSPWPPGLVSMSCVITPANYTPLCWVYMVSNYGEYLWWAFMMRIYGEYSWWVSHDPPYYGQAWEVHGASMNVPSVSLTWYFSASYSISLHLSQCRALVPVFNIWQFLPDAEGALVPPSSLSHWPCCCQRKWVERNVNTFLKLKIFISPEETRVRSGVISFVLILSSKHWTTNLMCRTSSLIASISNKTKTQTQTIAEEIFTQTVQFALHGTVRWLIVPQILLQFTAWIMFCSYLQRSKIQIGLRPQPASTVTIIVTIPRL